MPRRAHESPVVPRDGVLMIEGGWLVWEGGEVGVEDEEHPMPSKAHVSSCAGRCGASG